MSRCTAVIMALACAGCGATSLAMQRSYASQEAANGVICVRPDENTHKAGDGAVSVGRTTVGGEFEETFELGETPRARCLREAARAEFKNCMAFANGMIDREQYLARVEKEEKRCDRYP